MCVVPDYISSVWFFETLKAIAHQTPRSMGVWILDTEYWSGLPYPLLEDRLHSVIKLATASISCIAGRFFTLWTTWVAHNDLKYDYK